MNTVNRLLALAKNTLQANADRLTIAFIRQEPDGQWLVDAHLWDGVPGSGSKRDDNRIICKYTTLETAQQGLEDIKNKYPVHPKFVTLIDGLWDDDY